MKKFVAFMLVLCVGSVASAALQLSVDGVKEPVDSEIIIRPSETVIIDIWTNTAISLSGTTVWAAVIEPSLGSLGGNGHYSGPAGTYFDPLFQADQDNFSGNLYNNLDGLSMFPGKAGVQGNFTIWNSGAILDEFGEPIGTYPTIAANTTLFDGIVFHCLGVGDVTIELYQVSVSTGSSVLRDSVVIHQIPEPMTLGLLGLGGLLLRRKMA
jgi:hypothetical protein